jgi:hypothetical protein
MEPLDPPYSSEAYGAALAQVLRRNQVLEALLLTEDHLGTEAVPLGPALLLMYYTV